MHSDNLNTKKTLITNIRTNEFYDVKSIMEGLNIEIPKAKESTKETNLKIEFVSQLRQKWVLPTKELRQVVLFLIIKKFEGLKHQKCFISNETIIKELLEFGFEVSETTVKKDLSELENQGMIKRTFEKLQPDFTFRLINTFITPTLERFISLYKRIFQTTSNKCKAIPNSIGEVVEYFINQLKKPANEALRFFHYFTRNGWNIGHDKIVSWQGIANSWQSFKV